MMNPKAAKYLHGRRLTSTILSRNSDFVIFARPVSVNHNRQNRIWARLKFVTDPRNDLSARSDLGFKSVLEAYGKATSVQ